MRFGARRPITTGRSLARLLSGRLEDAGSAYRWRCVTVHMLWLPIALLSHRPQNARRTEELLPWVQGTGNENLKRLWAQKSRREQREAKLRSLEKLEVQADRCTARTNCRVIYTHAVT